MMADLNIKVSCMRYILYSIRDLMYIARVY